MAVLSSFRRDENGLSLTEALLVLPIVLLVITAMVEAGFAVFQWNQSVKAVQIGARIAAVSSPIVTDTAYANLTADEAGIDDGDPVPSANIVVTCGAGAASCDATSLNRLLTGSDGACASPGAPGSIVGMCDVAPFIEASNVRISYTRSGLGYVGRPFGPVTNITVELRDLTFDFLLLDALVPGISSFNIPAHPVSFTSEDLKDCRDPC
ncbi:MAG: pilus assembly protein [Litoreibacter sp.]|nr:pilus assembly protein [Boseongicola sp.]NNK79456.1 pilus assembly protein [Litoreibacter sp.]